jgi:hypothetical protein
MDLAALLGGGIGPVAAAPAAPAATGLEALLGGAAEPAAPAFETPAFLGQPAAPAAEPAEDASAAMEQSMISRLLGGAL